MAFTSAITHRSQLFRGGLLVNYGTYTNTDASEGGDIDTGMDRCLFIKLTALSDTVALTIPSVDETFPCEGHAVTVATAADEDGVWMAIGEGQG